MIVSFYICFIQIDMQQMHWINRQQGAAIEHTTPMFIYSIHFPMHGMLCKLADTFVSNAHTIAITYRHK